MCCLKGKIKLSFLQEPPPRLFNLFFNKKSSASKKFHENIRQYNNMFSFTSMGGKIDHSKNCGSAPYSFVLSGVNYHSIGGLLPPKGKNQYFLSFIFMILLMRLKTELWQLGMVNSMRYLFFYMFIKCCFNC